MILHPSAVVSISGALNAALVVTYTSNQVVFAGSASGSLRSHTETQGTECTFVASPVTREIDAESDVGILLSNGCHKYEVCVGDTTSSLGGRCTFFGTEEGAAKAHRDLTDACYGTSYSSCYPCTMSDGITPGKMCDGYQACNNVDTTKLSCGSCNGFKACFRAPGPFGESSCNGNKACYYQFCELNC
jgi:hypothetical protein